MNYEPNFRIDAGVGHLAYRDGLGGGAEANSEQSKATAEIRKLRGRVWYAGKSPDYGPVTGVSLALPFVTDAALEHVQGLTELQLLKLYGTHVTDAGLKRIKGLTKLQVLNLYGTQVTDAGVEKLQQALPKCKIKD